MRWSLKASVSWERPLVPKPLSGSQGQLLSLGLDQVQPRPWVSRAGVPPRGEVSWGRTVPGKDTFSGSERGEPAIRGIPLSAARTFASHIESLFWVPRQSPLGWSSPKPASRPCCCLMRGVRESPLSPRAPLSGGMGLAARGSTALFGDSYQGSCLCCS